MQERRNSSALAMELCLSCTNLSIFMSPHHWKIVFISHNFNNPLKMKLCLEEIRMCICFFCHFETLKDVEIGHQEWWKAYPTSISLLLMSWWCKGSGITSHNNDLIFRDLWPAQERFFNSLRLNNSFRRYQPRSSLVKIITYRLFGAKPSSEPMLYYCHFDL